MRPVALGGDADMTLASRSGGGMTAEMASMLEELIAKKALGNPHVPVGSIVHLNEQAAISFFRLYVIY